jgi:hypothetical protein
MASITDAGSGIDGVVRLLIPDEADLNQAAIALGPDALPHPGLLVRGPDPLLASKATYVAAQMRDPRATQILQIAATRVERMVRIAAATTVRSLPQDQASAILPMLLIDSDAECRQIAIEGVPSGAVAQLRSVLEILALTDPYPFVRQLAANILPPPGDSGATHEPQPKRDK